MTIRMTTSSLFEATAHRGPENATCNGGTSVKSLHNLPKTIRMPATVYSSKSKHNIPKAIRMPVTVYSSKSKHDVPKTIRMPTTVYSSNITIISPDR